MPLHMPCMLQHPHWPHKKAPNIRPIHLKGKGRRPRAPRAAGRQLLRHQHQSWWRRSHSLSRAPSLGGGGRGSQRHPLQHVHAQRWKGLRGCNFVVVPCELTGSITCGRWPWAGNGIRHTQAPAMCHNPASPACSNSLSHTIANPS